MTFLTGFLTEIFNVTSKNNKFYFTRLIKDDDFTQITIPHGVYGIESLDNETRRIIEEGHFTEDTYRFKIKPKFITMGSIIGIWSNIKGSQIAFTPNNSIRNILGFKPKNIFHQITPSIFYRLIISSSKPILLKERFSEEKEVV